jgi:hypothetical protein
MIFWKCKRKWKNENRVHSARPSSAHGPGAVGPAHEPFQPAGVLGRRGAVRSRSHHTQRACDGVLINGPAVTGRREGSPLEHEGASGVAPDKEGRPAAHHSDGAMARGRGDGGQWRSMVASELRWPETSSRRSCGMIPTRGGGEGKVHSIGGGSEAWLTKRSGRWRLQIRQRRWRSGRPERIRGRGG